MNIKQFHIKNKYYVSVNKIPSFYGCIAEFPYNIFSDQDELNKIYILDTDNYIIEHCVTTKGKNKNSNIQACSTNIRLLVVQDIILTAFRRKMSQQLIITKDTDKNLFDILDIPQTTKQSSAEALLCLEFRKLLSGEVSDSKIDGFDQLFFYFEKGGFTP